MSSDYRFEQIYVFAPLPNGLYQAAGTMTSDGRFRYGKRWLELGDSYPLDPINLPLSDKIFHTANRKGVFPVFSDAGPDDWGMKVLIRTKGRPPVNELERLLLTNGLGVGALRFSMSRSSIKEAPPLPHQEQLARLEELTNNLATGKSLSAEDVAFLYPASSMGGARPKVTFADSSGRWYLLKFAMTTDPVDVPRLEAAMLALARRAGIDVPTAEVRTFHADALCVERFDQAPCGKLHYVSAYSLFNLDRIPADDGRSPVSYGNLARMIRRFSAAPLDDSKALYRRMVFNVAINNGDDHGRNHGVLYNPQTQEWRLAPAFDLVPSLKPSPYQALAIGKAGRVATLRNALSMTGEFGLSKSEALDEVERVFAVVGDWQAEAVAAGLSSRDIGVAGRVINERLDQLDAELREVDHHRSIGRPGRMIGPE